MTSSIFPLGRQARLAVLASGRGSNLGALIAAFPPGGEDELAAVRLVVSNKAAAPALAKARLAGIPAGHVPWPSRSEFEERLGVLLAGARIDVICLAGFMRLLSPEFTQQWSGRLVNVHPSLLPAFPGLDAHAQALSAGVSETGCSIHLVDEGVDTGPVILQRRVPVLPGDDVESLSARVLEAEHAAYPEALRMLLSGHWTHASERERSQQEVD